MFDIAEPNRPQLRNANELPMDEQSNSDKEAPNREAMNILQLEPKRAKLRNAREEPIPTLSKTEREDPIRCNPNNAKDEPMRR
jgi:hypothetical protein